MADHSSRETVQLPLNTRPEAAPPTPEPGLAGRAVREGRADLAALGRSVLSTLGLLRGRWNRATHEAAFVELATRVGRRALDLDLPDPAREPALEARSRLFGIEADLELADRDLLIAEADLARERGEARTLLDVLDGEIAERGRTIAELVKAGAVAGNVETLRAELAEAGRHRDDRVRAWKEREVELESALKKAQLARATVDDRRRQGAAELDRLANVYGRALIAAGPEAPELAEILDEARRSRSLLAEDDSTLGRLRSGLRLDQLRALRAIAVLLGLVLILLLALPLFRGDSGSSRARSGDREEEAVTTTTTTPAASAPIRSAPDPTVAATTGPQPTGTDEALRRQLLTLPLFTANGLEPDGSLEIESDQEAASGGRRLEFRVGLRPVEGATAAPAPRRGASRAGARARPPRPGRARPPAARSRSS